MSDSKLIRVNSRLSAELNDFLDKRSAETGVSKSTLIYLAVESYAEKHKVLGAMEMMPMILSKLEALEEKVDTKD